MEHLELNKIGNEYMKKGGKRIDRHKSLMS